MSEQTSQEPTMEEILASIRRIISEDDAPASADAAPGDPPAVAAEAAAPEPEAEPEPELEAAREPEPEAAPEPVVAEEPAAPELVAETEEEVLELTDRVESHGDLDVYPAQAEPEPAPAPAPPPVAEAPVPVAAIVSTAAATAAASAFGQLSAAIAMPKGERTLEDVVRELLQPLLKDWLDTNLPRIVEAAVQEEVERIARGRVR